VLVTASWAHVRAHRIDLLIDELVELRLEDHHRLLLTKPHGWVVSRVLSAQPFRRPYRQRGPPRSHERTSSRGPSAVTSIHCDGGGYRWTTRVASATPWTSALGGTRRLWFFHMLLATFGREMHATLQSAVGGGTERVSSSSSTPLLSAGLDPSSGRIRTAVIAAGQRADLMSPVTPLVFGPSPRPTWWLAPASSEPPTPHVGLAPAFSEPPTPHVGLAPALSESPTPHVVACTSVERTAHAPRGASDSFSSACRSAPPAPRLRARRARSQAHR
jgi:hypothetical protein